MKKLSYLFASIFLVGLVVTSCGSSKNIVKPADINISGNWSLVSLNGQDATTLFETQIPSMSIDQSYNTISGYAGCNTFSGPFTLEKESFNSPNLITTLMMCNEKNAESELMQAISGESKVSITDGRLTFNKDGKTVAQFEKGIDNALLFGNWTLERIDGQSASVIFPDSPPTISFFTAKNSISGYAGCNNYNATYGIDGFELKIGAIMTTRMACQNSAGESKFIKNLSDISTIRLKDNTIVLFKNGKETLVFKKK